MTQEEFDSKLFALDKDLDEAKNKVEDLENEIEELWQEEIEE